MVLVDGGVSSVMLDVLACPTVSLVVVLLLDILCRNMIRYKICDVIVLYMMLIVICDTYNITI